MSQIVENIFSSKKFKLPQKIFLGVFRTYLNVKKCFLNDSRWFALAADFWKKSCSILLKMTEISASFFFEKVEKWSRWPINRPILYQKYSFASKSSQKNFGSDRTIIYEKNRKSHTPPQKHTIFGGESTISKPLKTIVG